MKHELKLDVHTHTVMSGHAYSTLQEMAGDTGHYGACSRYTRYL